LKQNSRDAWKISSLKTFSIDLNEKLFKVNLDSININTDVDNVSSIFMSVLDKHAPLRPMSRREKHLSEEPWITPGILKSIKTENKLFRKLYKNSNFTVKHFTKNVLIN